MHKIMYFKDKISSQYQHSCLQQLNSYVSFATFSRNIIRHVHTANSTASQKCSKHYNSNKWLNRKQGWADIHCQVGPFSWH